MDYVDRWYRKQLTAWASRTDDIGNNEPPGLRGLMIYETTNRMEFTDFCNSEPHGLHGLMHDLGNSELHGLLGLVTWEIMILLI